MFGRKQLIKDVKYWREQTQETREWRDKFSKDAADARESATAYEKDVIDLTEDLVREREMSQAFADENRDLVRQLELLRAVFKQLSISVKLPARKK